MLVTGGGGGGGGAGRETLDELDAPDEVVDREEEDEDDPPTRALPCAEARTTTAGPTTVRTGRGVVMTTGFSF
ncbi:MAG TPA: hypothetical protein VFI44_09700, partial [Ornithinibacter sp.]|nr:hypothetical protein [Ornithinibacter sp.]